METYIVRIYRPQEKGDSPAAAGMVEDAATGRKTKFADGASLLKALKFDKPAPRGKAKAAREMHK